MKIYIVTSGWYSDYMIEGVFLDEEKAQMFADVTRNANPVEEYETKDDEFDIMHSKRHYNTVEVSMINDEEPRVYFYTFTSRFGGKHSYIERNYIGEECIIYRKNIEYSSANHEMIKKKAIKAAYNLKSVINYLKSEGYSAEKINEIINMKG